MTRWDFGSAAALRKIRYNLDQILSVPGLLIGGSPMCHRSLRYWIFALLVGSCLLWSAPPTCADESPYVKALFTKPTRDYATAPLWVWNDMLTERADSSDAAGSGGAEGQAGLRPPAARADDTLPVRRLVSTLAGGAGRSRTAGHESLDLRRELLPFRIRRRLGAGAHARGAGPRAAF